MYIEIWSSLAVKTKFCRISHFEIDVVFQRKLNELNGVHKPRISQELVQCHSCLSDIIKSALTDMGLSTADDKCEGLCVHVYVIKPVLGLRL